MSEVAGAGALAGYSVMPTSRTSASLACMLAGRLIGVAVGEPRFDAIQSTRGIQHSKVQPILSDDFVVCCIMILFLLLFCFGKQ